MGRGAGHRQAGSLNKKLIAQRPARGQVTWLPLPGALLPGALLPGHADSRSPPALGSGGTPMGGVTVMMPPIDQVCPRAQLSPVWSHRSPGRRAYMPISQKQQRGPRQVRGHTPGPQLGPRLRFSPGRSHALPATCLPPQIPGACNLAAALRVVSAPSLEAFKQPLERQTLARHRGFLAKGEVGPSGCGHTALLSRVL